MRTTLDRPEPRLAPPVPPVPAPAWCAGHVLAALLAALMVATSLGGLLADGFYADDVWGRAAFRGNDLATLAVATPLLLAALAASVRGSRRGRLVTLGMLAYGVYDYAFYVFGAAWGDWFLLHVAAFVVALYGLVALAPAAGTAAVPARTRRAVAAYTGLVGAGLAGMWAYVSVRYAATGEVDAGTTPLDAMHAIFAIDLTLIAPALVAAAVLLWRGHAQGVAAAVAVNVVGAVYQVALAAGAAFQADAGIEGKAWLTPSGVVVAAGSAAAAALLLRQVRGSSA